MAEAATLCTYNINPNHWTSWQWCHLYHQPPFPELPVPIGAVGEILIESPHLSRGYLDRLCLKPDFGSPSPLHNGSRIYTRLVLQTLGPAILVVSVGTVMMAQSSI